MIPLALFLLACAVVYVGTIEAAFSGLMRLSLRLLVERNGRGAVLERYLDEPVRLLVPIRIWIAILLALIAGLVARSIGLGGAHTFGLFAGSMVGIDIVCEHLLPALLARRDPERILMLLLPSFDMASRVIRPVTAPIVDMMLAVRREPVSGSSEGHEAPGDVPGSPAEAEVQDALMEREGRRLVQSIMEFRHALVREVMTPRPDIVAIRSDATLEGLAALFREQEYSRFPVYKDNLDNIVGIAFVKDLIQITDPAAATRPLTTIVRPAYFVPETKRVPELLREFQRQQIQCAIVVDEYGGTAGLATIEDLLEEIVGEIRDEYDVESDSITDEGNGAYVFSGKVDVDEVADRLHVQIPREGFETIGGYLMSHLGRVPGVGERFDFDGLNVEVLEAERRRVTKVRLRKSDAMPQLAGE